MNNSDLIRQVSAELQSYGKKPIVRAELSALSAIELIAMLQLCTRHPLLPASQQQYARDLVDKISAAFKPEHRAIAETIRRGWDQQYDQEVSA